MVGNAGVSDCTEIDGVEVPQPIDSVFGHHAPRPVIGFAGPPELGPLEFDPLRAAGRLQNPDTLGYHFPADAVTRDDRYFQFLHLSSAQFTTDGLNTNSTAWAGG